MSDLNEPQPEATAPTCTPTYDVNDPQQQEVSRLLKSLQHDVMGVIALGKDGIMRSLTANRKVLSAVPFTPEQSKALHDRLPEDYRKEHGVELLDVDGSKTPKEKWFEPDEGILPAPLAQEKIDEIRNYSKERKDMLRKLVREKDNYVDTDGILDD